MPPDPCRVYARRILLTLIRHIQNQIAPVESRRRLEPLHQLRVTLRRLRNALKVFRPLLPRQKVRRWNAVLKSVARQSSEARDLDVQMEFLKSRRRAVDSNGQALIAHLLNDLSRRRDRAQAKLVAANQSLTRKRVLHEIQAELLGPISRQQRTLSDLACRKIKKRVDALLAFDAVVSCPGKIHELHQMRIAAKHLRYTLEVFRGHFGPSKMDKSIACVIALQRALGTIHDMDVWLGQLREISQSSFVERCAVDTLARSCQHERAKAYHRLVSLWRSYRKARFWRKLDQLILQKEN